MYQNNFELTCSKFSLYPSRSKGCKLVFCLTLKMICLSRTQTRAARVWLDSGRAAGFFLDLQLWQLVFLQSFDLQRPAIPLWKDLNLLYWLRFCPRDQEHFKHRFALSNWPHFNRAYVLGVFTNISTTVVGSITSERCTTTTRCNGSNY